MRALMTRRRAISQRWGEALNLRHRVCHGFAMEAVLAVILRRPAGMVRTFNSRLGETRTLARTTRPRMAPMGGTTRLAPRRTLTWTKGEHSRGPQLRRPAAAGIGLASKDTVDDRGDTLAKFYATATMQAFAFWLGVAWWLPTPIKRRPMDVVASGPNQ